MKKNTTQIGYKINQHTKLSIYLLYLFSALLYFLIGINSYEIPRTLSDEGVYISVARSLFNQFQITYRGQPLMFTSLLYPISILPSMWMRNEVHFFYTIKLLNSFYICSTVFPVFLLSQRIAKERAISFFIAMLSIFIPEMVYSYFALTESLYYPLFIWLVYFIYLELTGEERIDIKIPIFLFLLYWTKGVSLCILIGLNIAYFIFMFTNKKLFFTRLIVYDSIFLLLYAVNRCAVQMLSGAGDEAQNMYAGQFEKVFNFDFVSNIVYGINHYILFFVLAFGVLPVFIPLLNIRNLYNCLDQFVCFLYITLGVFICVIVFSIFELEDSIFIYDTMRVHVRYVFPFYILFFILMNDTLKKLSELPLNNFFILSAVYFCILWIVWDIQELRFMPVDCPSLALFYTITVPFFKMGNSVKVIFFTVFSFVMLKLLYNKNINRKVINICLIGILCFNVLLSNAVIFKNSGKNSQYALKNIEIKEMSNFINHQLNQEGNVLLTSNHYWDVEMSVLDMYLYKEPFYIDITDLTGDFLNKVPKKYGREFPNNKIEDIQYIVCYAEENINMGSIIFENELFKLIEYVN